MPIINFSFKPSDVPAGAANVRAALHSHTHSRYIDGKYHDVPGPTAIWLWDTHVGLCISDRERNGYDDSDFFMLVWDQEAGKPEEIMFATTRGWSYPSYGSQPDATPEVRALYDAWHVKQIEADRLRRAEREAAVPRKDRRVVVTTAVTRGKNKVEAGVTGTVFWFGADSFDRSDRYRTPMQSAIISQIGDPSRGMRVGVLLDDGRKVFIAATSVDVVRDQQEEAA